MSTYNFEQANVPALINQFNFCEQECQRLLAVDLPLPAYEYVLRASHAFNLLDARHAVAVTERQGYILRIRKLAQAVAQSYYQAREKLGFPLLRAEATS